MADIDSGETHSKVLSLEEKVDGLGEKLKAHEESMLAHLKQLHADLTGAAKIPAATPEETKE